MTRRRSDATDRTDEAAWHDLTSRPFPCHRCRVVSQFAMPIHSTNGFRPALVVARPRPVARKGSLGQRHQAFRWWSASAAIGMVRLRNFVLSTSPEIHIEPADPLRLGYTHIALPAPPYGSDFRNAEAGEISRVPPRSINLGFASPRPQKQTPARKAPTNRLCPDSIYVRVNLSNTHIQRPREY